MKPIFKGAHAIERRARILTALGSIGFPVALICPLLRGPSAIIAGLRSEVNRMARKHKPEEIMDHVA